MDRQQIIEELRLQNPWWEGEEVKLADKTIKRDLEDQLIEELDRERITTIIGLRRVGKTTLMKRMVDNLLDRVDEKRICYFSFDLAADLDLRDLIGIYEEEILKEPMKQATEKVFFFFDEVQKIENWGNEVKSIYDHISKVKFIVSGSSSLNITKGTGESLVGRVKIRKLRPFSFAEFLRFKGTEPPQLNFTDLTYPSNSSDLRIKFNQYKEQGGMPELYKEDSQELLKQMLDLAFFRDILELFPVKRIDVLKGIFRVIAENSGQKVNYSNLSNNFDTDFRTVKNYLQYLEDSFLIEQVRPYEGSVKKSMRKNPKVYLSDHAYNKLWKCEEGLKAEMIAFNHLKRIEQPYFNLDPEVDLVLPEAEKAFEVKYRDSISKRDAVNLSELPDEFDKFLVTKRDYDTWNIHGQEIQLIPLWMLCLIAGSKFR